LRHELANDDLLAAFDYVFLPLANKYKPNYVPVSAGFDAGAYILNILYVFLYYN
jgi:acetoin utilization deacetylase AcuC-like enzyme